MARRDTLVFGALAGLMLGGLLVAIALWVLCPMPWAPPMPVPLTVGVLSIVVQGACAVVLCGCLYLLHRLKPWD